MHFYKYQGTGNDFIIIDDRNENFDIKNLDLVQHLCDRKFGIGADGLIVLRDHQDYDFHMIYFNADGSQSFCGNGSRCCVKFAHEMGIVEEKAIFLSTDGPHEAFVLNDGRIALQMHDVNNIKELGLNNYELNTGSPHYIRFVEDLRKEDVLQTGRTIRYSPPYSEEGINVNLVQIDTKKGACINMQTYERGVEDETLSCGTGVTAAALVYAMLHKKNEKVEVVTKGGVLEVAFQKNADGSFSSIFLMGPAEKVFEGKWEK